MGVSKYNNSGNVRSEGLNVYRYPNNVGSDEYPNYIMFNITKRVGDIGNAETATGELHTLLGMIQDTSRNSRPDLSPRLAALVGAGTALVGGHAAGLDTLQSVGTHVAKAIPNAIPAGDEIVKNAATVAGNAAGALVAGTALIAVGALSMDRDRVLLKTTIALHLNNKPSVSYKAQWADKELGIIGGAGAVFGDIKAEMAGKESIGGNIEGVLGGAMKALQGVGGAAATMALKKANDTPLKELGDTAAFFEAGTGQAMNPFKAQLFKNMEFRTFTFDYVFLPRDAVEYNSVQDIIKTFKRYMHPTLGKENFFLGYPAEFNITYFHKNQANYENIFKLANCALTDLKVEYGGADFVTFKGRKGAPTEIAMSLSFIELELLTEERVMDGY